MKITESTAKKITLTELGNLDLVNVYLEDFGPGQGRITIECFGDAWSYYWGHMGPGHDLSSFFRKAETDYLGSKLHQGEFREWDMDAIRERVGEALGPDKADDLCYDHPHALDSEVMAEVFGPDWYMDMPQRTTSQYRYLCRIIEAVKAALQEMADQQRQEGAGV